MHWQSQPLMRAVQQLDVLRRPLIGAMIETPAALFALDEIFELADFVAIGTNDLTQYMLAADRDLSEGTDDCTAMHPAVLRAIKQIVESGLRWGRPVCVCGEEAADGDFARLLVGLGIRELSLSPGRGAPATRYAIRGTDSRQATELAELALQCRSPSEVRELLANGLAESSPLDYLPGGPELLSEPMIPRHSESQLLSPADIKPAGDAFEVIGVFNPGVVRMGNEVLMLAQGRREATCTACRFPGLALGPKW